MANHFEIDGEANPFGNSAQVTVSKRWRDADVKVVRTSEPKEGTNERYR